MKKGLARNLNNTRQFFNKTIECFSEEDSSFAPSPGLYTVAGHVEHAAQSIDWFLEGAFQVAIISGIVDHTAHHRGALAVYSRLLGKTPSMPYA